MSFIKNNALLVGMFLMIVCAYFLPEIGSLPWLSVAAKYGVSLIFFFYGLKLEPKELLRDLTHWRLHLVIQIATFLLFPLIVLGLRPWIEGEDLDVLWLSLFFMASLPSAVSSVVVMVSLAKGNVTASIFNSTLSALLGIIFTPLWMGFVISQATQDINVTEIFVNLLLTVIAPLFVGILLHRVLKKWTFKNRNYLNIYDQLVILLIVFSSFAKSFKTNLFLGFQPEYILYLLLGLIGLFTLVFVMLWAVTAWLGLNPKDRITATYNGVTKSLVHGSVMSKIIFANATFLGFILLPIMLYHSLQLLILGVLSKKLRVEE